MSQEKNNKSFPLHTGNSNENNEPYSPIESVSGSFRDEKKTWSRASTPDGDVHREFKAIETGHVNVRRAEEQFEELNLELKESNRQSSIRRTASRGHGHHDLEKAVSTYTSRTIDEPFDLQSTIRGNRADAEASGAKFKKIGVLWNDLTARGLGGQKIFVQTFPSKVMNFFNYWPTIRGWFGQAKKGAETDILRSFKGLCKPDEMVLVLGRPGSGCTTFLKVISNQRFGYTNISGEVLYGPFDANTFEKQYRGEAVYNAEDESSSMLPTLTVGQTLDFALNTKIPGHRPAGISRKEFKEKVINLLLKMFNIEVSLKL